MCAAVIRIQTVITRRAVIRFRKPQTACRAVDPAGRAFQFQIHSDGRLVQRGYPRFTGAAVFGAELLVSERGEEIQAGQHLAHPVRIGYLDFQFFAVLVLAGGFRALVSQNALRAGLANAQQASVAAQRARRSVEQGIGFEETALGDAEPGGAQQAASGGGVRYRQLDLDLARGARTSYSFLPTIA